MTRFFIWLRPSAFARLAESIEALAAYAPNTKVRHFGKMTSAHGVIDVEPEHAALFAERLDADASVHVYDVVEGA